MKILLVYSSLTGNTKKLAEKLFEIMPEDTEIYKVEDAPEPDNYDLVCVGFWADRENADKKAQEFMKKISSKNVFLFATLGAYPDSEHAVKTMKNAKSIVQERNTVVGEFICQGKVDENLVKRFSQLPPEHPHGMTAARKARIEEASKHPNEDDFSKARQVLGLTIQKI